MRRSAGAERERPPPARPASAKTWRLQRAPTALAGRTPLLALALAPACSGRAATPPPRSAAPAAPTPAPAPAATDSYPTLFTAEQIRDATRRGRAYTFRVEVSGAPPSERTIPFTEVGAEGATIVRDGAARRVTWEGLRQHAQFPREQVATREETVTVPAGTDACTVYVVAGPASSETSTFYFARDLPGAPVPFFTEKSGARQMTSTPVRYAPGAAD